MGPGVKDGLLSDQARYLIWIEPPLASPVLDLVPIRQRIKNIPLRLAHFFRKHLRVIGITFRQGEQRVNVVVSKTIMASQREIYFRTIVSGLFRFIQFIYRPVKQSNRT